MGRSDAAEATGSRDDLRGSGKPGAWGVSMTSRRVWGWGSAGRDKHLVILREVGEIGAMSCDVLERRFVRGLDTDDRLSGAGAQALTPVPADEHGSGVRGAFGASKRARPER